jgi:hypothetical protein
MSQTDIYIELVEPSDAREWHGATWAVYRGETRLTEGSLFWCRIWSLLHGYWWPPKR